MPEALVLDNKSELLLFEELAKASAHDTCIGTQKQRAHEVCIDLDEIPGIRDADSADDGRWEVAVMVREIVNEDICTEAEANEEERAIGVVRRNVP